MKFFTLAGFLLTSLFVIAPGHADAQTACEYYRVQKGDSLRDIARAAYGRDNYRRVWRENRAEIGRNPNLIEVGMVLRIPCIDGSFPTENAGAKPEAATDNAFSFVTANGYLPYTDESLDQRGFVTHIVSQAMMRADPEQPIDIVFVNDWAAHLEALLPRQAFDASFPWTRPGCETQGELTSVELYACQNYLYSNPLYEIVESFYSLNGSGFDGMLEFAGYKGTTICRPEGYPTSHLEENGLMPPEINLVQPTSAHDCFALLQAGKVEVVALDSRAAERVMSETGMTFNAVENPHLFSILPLQVAVHKDNPKSADIIAKLNLGLKNMAESGEWAAIVTEGLRKQAEALMN